MVKKSKVFVCIITGLMGLYLIGTSNQFKVLAVSGVLSQATQEVSSTPTENTTEQCLQLDSQNIENCTTPSLSETSTDAEKASESSTTSSHEQDNKSSSPVSALANTFGINTKLLIGQLINFVVVVLAFAKFVVKPVAVSMQKRSDKIEAGLKMAERVQFEREEFVKSQENQSILLAKKEKSIINAAELKAQKIVEDATEKARDEASRIIEIAHQQTETELAKAKVELKKMTFEVASTIATKVLQREIKLSNTDPLIENNLK